MKTSFEKPSSRSSKKDKKNSSKSSLNRVEKKRFWDRFASFEEAEKNWDEGSKEKEKISPLKVLKNLPNMPGIAPECRKSLKRKSLYYLIKHDEKQVIMRYILKKPFSYLPRLLLSLCKKKAYKKRDGDFYYYGCESDEEFKKALQHPKTLFVIGFSYCHKPFECPSGRFTDQCIHDPEHSACRQCFIGKCVNAMPEKKTQPLFIPTIHYIGEKLLEIIDQNPDRKVIFLITACEMTLEMFGDFGNMANILGIGVRLDGRICNTLKAFELSERGIKPGLTVVLEKSEKKMLDLIRSCKEH